MVNMTTQRDYSDTTVVLHIGEHPFIKHPTIVNYQDARIVKVANLIAAYHSRLFKPQAPFSMEILQKIRKGIFDSPLTPEKIKTYCRTQFTF